MLQCVAVCCSVLQCVAVCCSVLQCHMLQSYVGESGSAWFCVCAATKCNLLQHIATHCNTLQHAATHCTLELTFVGDVGLARLCVWDEQRSATHCNTLQRISTHCNILKHTATHFNILHLCPDFLSANQLQCGLLFCSATHCYTL